jgi:sarcosine oxidase subunit gamma
MSALEFIVRPPADRFGLKGPNAPEWLAAAGLEIPAVPNTWTSSSLFVARLGASEFFLEDLPGGTALRQLLEAGLPRGVYPVLREDSAFRLSGDGAFDVLAQVCSIDFSSMVADDRPVIMTSMVGVSVIVVAYEAPDETRYRIWCDPTFGRYLQQTLGHIVIECGGNYTGVSE